MENGEAAPSDLHVGVGGGEEEQEGPNQRHEEADCVAAHDGAAQQRRLRPRADLVHLADAVPGADGAEGGAGEDEDGERERALRAVAREGEEREREGTERGAVEGRRQALLRAPEAPLARGPVGLFGRQARSAVGGEQVGEGRRERLRRQGRQGVALPEPLVERHEPPQPRVLH